MFRSGKDRGALEWLARDKHSSLIRKSVNYGRYKFYDAGPWFHLAGVLKKDITIWVDGARPTPNNPNYEFEKLIIWQTLSLCCKSGACTLKLFKAVIKSVP